MMVLGVLVCVLSFVGGLAAASLQAMCRELPLEI
jgi:hypothetical protein